MTRGDSLLPFLRFVVGTGAYLRRMAALSPMLLGFLLGLVRNDRAKERVLTSLVAGRQIGELQERGVAFAAQVIPTMVRPAALERLRWHQEQRHRCVLVSASPELYLEPWARPQGFDDVLATRLATDGGGRITGSFVGANCRGPEKLRRLEGLLGPRSGYVLYAYGDSKGDRELLAAADHAFFRRMG